MIIDQLFENNKKPLNEVDPRNFDSDEDYYAAVNAPSKPKYRGQQSPGVNPDDEDYFREIFRKKREAAKKAAQDKESGTTESQVYESFHHVGRMLAERKMSEKEILDVFAQAEQGMTDTATGANRTALGRGKDTVGRGITSAKDAITKVLSSIQNSTPVAGVDVAYDQATDALANVVGNNSKIMDSIKKYRLLAKEYPKTQLFVKTALIALAGLASGGAGLPVIAGLTAAVDSAIKGEKLSSIIGKGAGAGLMGLGAQEVSSMLSDSGAEQQDFQLPAADAAMNSQADIDAANEWINADEATRAEIEQITGLSPEKLQSIANGEVSAADSLAPGEEIIPTGGATTPGAEGFGGGTYTVQAGDQGGFIAQANGISFPDLQGLNPQVTDWNNLKPGTELQLPPANTQTGSVWNSGAVRESVKFKTIPADQLIDQKLTVLTWALNESVNRKSNNIHLTTKGVYTVFENVDRYRKAILEAAGPGREQLPAYYRPDMPGAPSPQTAKPGMIGRGLNWLDKKAGQVGGALSNFGHQFTTGVTKEKLKMNWHQAGKPTDSDQLAAFLAQQKVPQEVITDVFSKMSIPYTAPAPTEPAAAEPAQATAKAQQPWAIAAVNPATGKQWTPSELGARYRQTTAKTGKAAATGDLANVMLRPSNDAIDAAQPASGTTNLPQATTSVIPTATPAKSATTAAAGPAGWNDPKSANYVGRREVARRQAAQPAAPAQAKPSYAGPAGYGSVKMNAPTVATLPSTIKPTAPAGTKVTAGGPTAAERAALDKRIAAAAAQPVTETVKQVKRMMETVTSRADVQRIKDYIDYHMGANLTESAQLKRNRLLSEVTRLAATRRREIASRMV